MIWIIWCAAVKGGRAGLQHREKKQNKKEHWKNETELNRIYVLEERVG